MKKASLSLVLLMMAVSLFCQPWDGPFGLKMGLTYNQLKAIDPGIEKIDEDRYVMTKVPTPHPDFEDYWVTLSTKSGLVKIGAFTKTIESSGNGWQLRNQFWGYAQILGEKYGDYETLDYLDYNSIWTDPQYFMTGLAEKERTLKCTWSDEIGSSLYNNLSYIWLLAGAYDVFSGFVYLGYQFTNGEAFFEAQENKKKQAF